MDLSVSSSKGGEGIVAKLFDTLLYVFAFICHSLIFNCLAEEPCGNRRTKELLKRISRQSHAPFSLVKARICLSCIDTSCRNLPHVPLAKSRAI